MPHQPSTDQWLIISGVRSKKRQKTWDSNNSGESNASEDPRSRFYGDYRKVAEEYDKEFMNRYEEDLNTTLIFVSLVFFLSLYFRVLN